MHEQQMGFFGAMLIVAVLTATHPVRPAALNELGEMIAARWEDAILSLDCPEDSPILCTALPTP
jgi:hypothetical protein